MKNETLIKFSKMSKPQQLLFVVALFVVFLLLSAYVVGGFATIKTGSVSTAETIMYAFNNLFSLTFFLAGALTLFTVFFFLLRKRSMRNTIESKKDGVFYAKDKNSGASRWETEDEIRTNFKVGKVEDSTSTIYGRLNTYGSDEVVSWKAPERLTERQLKSGMKQSPEGNRNVLVIATMGSGKTFTYVENEIIQTVLRGDSFVVTDPKGEIFKNLTKFCQDRNVDVHTINLVEPQYSEFWNCLKETINPETERLDATRLDEFSLIYMENANKDADTSSFWFLTSLNLVKTTIGYVAWKHETQIIEKFLEVYKKVANITTDTVVENALSLDLPMKYFKNLIREKAKENNYDLDEIEDIIKEIEKYGSEYRYNIGEVYDVLLKIDEILNDPDETQFLEDIPIWHPAAKAYRTFKINDGDNVRKSAIQNALLAFSIFTNRDIKDALSNDGMNLRDINEKQSGYVIITSDKPGGSVYKPVLSLFFSFFFKDTMDNYDRHEQISAETGEKNSCKGVTAMLEEFYSIGKINEFETIMTTCRSRHIYVSVIIQHIKLLEELYGRNNKNTIDSACDTTYFLGANDLDTMDYISKKAGNASILKESHHEENNFRSRMNTDVNVSTASRPLLTPEEVRMWNSKVLLIRKGLQPVELNPFPWTDHWVMNNEKYVKGYIHMNGYNVAPDSAMPYNKFISPIQERMNIISKEFEEHSHENEGVIIANRLDRLKKIESKKVVDDVAVSSEVKIEKSERESELEKTQEIPIIIDNIVPITKAKTEQTIQENNKETVSESNLETKVEKKKPSIPTPPKKKKPSNTGRSMRQNKAKKVADESNFKD